MSATPRARSSFSDYVSDTLATGLGSGYSPFAPGTAGSLVGLLLFWPLAHYATLTVQITLTVALFFVGVATATRLASRLGRKDPGRVVIDEWLGMWVSLLGIPWGLKTGLLAFFLFRVMDVIKPPPARQFEAAPAGWGIMLDDLMAGIYANLVLQAWLFWMGGR